MITETEIAYTAGIIDGEGSIGYGYYTNTHRITLTVGSCDMELLAWLRQRWSGNICRYGSTRPNESPSYKWTVTGSSALPVLTAIYPYLVIPSKVRRAEWAIEICQIQAARRGNYYPDEDRLRIEELADEFRRDRKARQMRQAGGEIEWQESSKSSSEDSSDQKGKEQ